MKTLTFLVSTSVVLMMACSSNSSKLETNNNHQTPFHALFLFQESGSPDSLINHELLPSGAIYLTEKGNLILHTIKEKSDTQHYYWGKYQFTDDALTYLITDEYYFYGKWDASWDVPHPDYLNGKSRKASGIETKLTKIIGDSLRYFRTYTEAEKTEASKRYLHSKPNGIEYWPYYEPAEQKFYTWFYKHAPVLSNL